MKLSMSKISAIVIFAMVMCTAVFYFKTSNSTDNLKAKLAEQEKIILENEEKLAELDGKEEYYMSDAYVEEMARQYFGYIKSNEIVFIDRNTASN